MVQDGYFDCNLEGLMGWEESLLCIDQRPETRSLDAAQLLTPIPRVSGGQELSCPSLRQWLLRAYYVVPLYLFRHLFKDLLSTYCVLGTMLVAGDTTVNKTDIIPLPSRSSHSS